MDDDRFRLKFIFGFAALGVGLAFAGFGIAVWAFHGTDKPGEVIPAVLGPLTTLIGTLAGYVSGQQAGAAGKEKAENRAAEAQQLANEAQVREAVVSGLAPNIVDQARAMYPDLFKEG